MDRERPEEGSSSPRDDLLISSLEKRGTRAERYRVLLSDGSSFFIARELVWEEGLYPGAELSVENLSRLKRKAELYEVEKKAFTLLARSPHSIRALRNKLIKRGFTGNAVEEVLKRYEELGYLDDRDYAEEWLQVRIRRHPEGRAALLSGLIRRGVSREVAEEAVAAFITPEVEEECAQRFLEKLKNSSEASGREIARKLSGRGFDYRIIRRLAAEDQEYPEA